MKDCNCNSEEILLTDTERLRLLCDLPETGLVIDFLDQVRSVQVEPVMLAEKRKVAIVGSPDGSTIKSLMKKLADDKEYVVVSIFSDTVGYIKEALNGYRVENLRRHLDRGWDQPKLRRGKGHNKLKRKGKK